MSKTLLCVNVLDNVNSEVYSSHCQEWFRLGRNTKDDFILFTPNRFSIDNARNQAALFALKNQCDYLYFIDDDMILSPNTYQSLKSCNAEIAQALTFIRGYPFHCMAFKRITPANLGYFDDYGKHVDGNGIFECDAVGFACCLIDVACLKMIEQPYFITSSTSTEDVYFCIKLKDRAKKNVKIVVDTRVPTAHILGSEAISVYNLEKMKAFYEKGDPEQMDRGMEYLERCKKQFH